MSARYEFKVGPANRHSEYAKPVTVIADTYREAQAKAIGYRGFTPQDSGVWLIRVEEIPATEPPAPFIAARTLREASDAYPLETAYGGAEHAVLWLKERANELERTTT